MNWTRLLFWLALACAFSATNGIGAEDPSVELASFRLPEGFEINLFASEADGVVKPIQCRFDARGRLWVIQSSVYPQIIPGQRPDDKVLILEDTNGDGRADKSTVFADGLMIPTGLEIVHDGCLVGHGTELLHLRDVDGDGKADERRVLLRGFGTGDNHQNINSFTWGAHGELWFSQGLHAHARVETPWGVEKLDQAGIWRLWPRRTRLDAFFGNNIAPHNPWGFIIDDWGDTLIVGGNGHGIFDTLPAQIRGHRPIDAPQIWLHYRGRKLCGVDVVGTAHFPESWQGLVLGGGFMANTVYTLKIEDDGAGYRVVDAPPILTSTHTSFRPVDVRFGPDGAVYVADWFNPIIGHYQASFRHPDRDKIHGRIWRITAKGRPLVKAPAIGADPAKNFDLLKSDERWTRWQARRALAEGGSAKETAEAAAGWVESLSATDPRYEERLAAAVGVLESREIVEPALVERLTRGASHHARAFAAGVIGHYGERMPNGLAFLERLAADDHPRARLAAVVASTYFPEPAAIRVTLIAAERPTDRFLDYAIGQAAYALKPHWLPAFQAGKLDLGPSATRLAALARADNSPDSLGAVRKLLADEPERQPVLWETLARVGDGDDWRGILERAAKKIGVHDEIYGQVLAAMAEAAGTRGMSASGDLNALLRPLLAAKNVDVRRGALRLVAAWKPADCKAAAAEALIDPSVAEAALEALAALDLSAASTYVVSALTRPSRDRAMADLAVVLLRRQGGAEALRQGIARRPPSPEMARLTWERLNEAGLTDAALLDALRRAAGDSSPTAKWSVEEIAALAREVREHGDAARGRDIFRRAELACMACHAVGGEGGLIGPSLDSIGSGQPVDFIIGAVLDPGREVKESFDAVEVVTKDGQSISGYRAGGDGQDMTIREMATNRVVRLSRDSVAKLTEKGSLMPPGLTDGLKREELRDLIRYLSELGKTQR